MKGCFQNKQGIIQTYSNVLCSVAMAIADVFSKNGHTVLLDLYHTVYVLGLSGHPLITLPDHASYTTWYYGFLYILSFLLFSPQLSSLPDTEVCLFTLTR